MASTRIHPVRTVIIQQHIDQYCRRQAAINKSKGIQDELKDDILEFFKKGNLLPGNGPSVLEACQNGGKEFDLEKEFLKLYAKYLQLQDEYTKQEAMALAQAYLKDLKDSAPEKKAVEVNGVRYIGGIKFAMKPNPSFKKAAAA